MPTRLFGYRAGMSTAALGGTFGRASTKMIPDASGTLVSVGSGVLADGDYIGGKRYVLLEGARTNLVTRSEPTVAQLGSSGGSPTNAAGAYGFSSGIGFPAGATQVWGYHTGLCAINTQYVLSVFLVMADGSAPRVGATSAASEDLSLLVAGSTVPASSCTVTQIAGSLYRATAVVTTGGTIGANNVGVVRQTTQSGKAFTVYGYQLEAASSASSYIPTTGSAGTRAADTLTFSGIPTGFAATQYVKYLDPSTGAQTETVSAITSAASVTLTTGRQWASYAVAPGVLSLAEMRSLAATPVTTPQTVATTLTISPSSFTVVAGQSQQLTVTVLDQFGASMSSQTPVTWRSSDGSVASVSSSGLVSALGAGSATITASCGAASGTASATITAAPVLTTVTVSPSTASASAGSTIQFTATGQDQFGATMGGLTFTWSSSAPTKATVDSNGLASCVSSGTVTITATSGSVSGTATLTIPAVNAQPAFTITYDNEPASMVAWQDRPFTTTPENSWSDSTISNLAFVDPTTDPVLSTWPADWSKGKSPTKVGKITFPTSQSGGQAPITTGKAENSLFYTELYHTIFVAVDPNWRGAGTFNAGTGQYSGSGVNKLFHYWMGDGSAGIDPTWPAVSGNTNRLYLMLNGRWDEDLKVEMRCQQCPKGVGFNDTWDSDHDGSFNLPSNLGTTAQRIVTRGVLNKIEVHAILNTPGSSDGLVEWWLNGVKIGSYTGIIWLNTNVGRRWRDIQLSPTYGGTEVPPQTQYMAIDHAYSKRK